MARSRTSFAPGNLAALRHGSRSLRLWKSNRANAVRRVQRELREGQRAYWKRMASRLEWQVSRYYAFLEREGGPLTPTGRERKCLDRCLRTERLLVSVYDRLEGRQSALAEESDGLVALLGHRDG